MREAGEPPLLDDDGRRCLVDLVRRMGRQDGPWGSTWGGQQTGPNTYEMPWVKPCPVVSDAMGFLHNRDLIVPFHWAAWDDGRAILAGSDRERFANLDRLTVLKLLTAVARSERFREGAWVSLFEDGHGPALFRRLLALELAYR